MKFFSVGRSSSQLSNRTESEELEEPNNVITDLENDITEFMDSEELTLTHDITNRGGNNNLNSDERPEEAIIRQMDETETDQEASHEAKDNQLRHRKVANTTDDATGTVAKELHDNENTESSKTQSTKVSERELTVKLKYLNDDLKMVTARSSEAIGDFKK